MAGPTDTRSHERGRRLLRALPALAWAAVIFAGSSLPGRDIPSGYSWQGHLTEYAVLGALVMFAIAGAAPDRRLAFTALAICALYAVTDEFHQSFVPGRMPDPLDWSTDVVGAALGIAAALTVTAWRSSRRRG